VRRGVGHDRGVEAEAGAATEWSSSMPDEQQQPDVSYDAVADVWANVAFEAIRQRVAPAGPRGRRWSANLRKVDRPGDEAAE